MAFTIATGGTWKIKVAQIECSNLARAYPDCDQYVTGATGTISSYNWPNIQLKAKDYQHCIRREQGNWFIISAHLYRKSLLQTFVTDFQNGHICKGLLNQF